MNGLVDTNILVYCYDELNPAKQVTAARLVRRGMATGDLVVPHQAIVEFVAATTRTRPALGGRSLLSPTDAAREAESLMDQFRILYPDGEVLRTALRGRASYQLSWWDAHLWAYAEVNGLDEILSEDFEHGRHYGSVRAHNPFLPVDEVHELPALYAP